MQQTLRPGGFNILPPIIKNLLIINTLVYFTTVVLKESQIIDLNYYLALFYWDSSYFKPWQIITHMFMHGSFMHIFFNMFALWMFGTAIERVWGPKRFLIYYMVTGFGAFVLHYAVVAWQINGLVEQIGPEAL